MGTLSAVLGESLYGGGIAGTHYIGMAAMRVPAKRNYFMPLVGLSVILAVVIAFVALTNLLNRKVEKSFSVVVCNIDNFKSINYSYGIRSAMRCRARSRFASGAPCAQETQSALWW